MEKTTAPNPKTTTPPPAGASSTAGPPQPDLTGKLRIVQNNNAGDIYLSLGYFYDGEGDKRRASISAGEIVTLVPGVNFVDAAQWEKAKTQENNRRLLETKVPPPPKLLAGSHDYRKGQPVLVEGPVVSEEQPLAKLSDAEAIELVADVLVIEYANGKSIGLQVLLDTMRGMNRPTVERAILDKIALISGAKQKDAAARA